jgi:hypothetical protein
MNDVEWGTRTGAGLIYIRGSEEQARRHARICRDEIGITDAVAGRFIWVPVEDVT